MALDEFSLIDDPQEVWDYLEATDEERAVLSSQMDSWINGATALLERMCNRKLKAREFEEVHQDGTGRPYLYLENYPIIEIDELTVFTWDMLTSYTIDVTDSTVARVENRTGRVTLLSGSPISTFLTGHGNIVATYEAGFVGSDINALQDAVKELILVKWRERGEHPLDLVTSQSAGANITSTKFDPRRLPHIVQQVADSYRRWEV